MKEIFANNSFSVLAHSFGISASQQDTTLMYSVDGVVWNAKADIPAGETILVINVPRGILFKLEGNNDTLVLKY